MKKSLFVFTLLAVALIFASRAQAQVLVIANPSVKAADVSKNDLRDVFTGAATSLKDGSHVTPVLLTESATHEMFLREYIAKSDGPFRTAWRSLVFSGQSSMPKSLDSESAVVAYVAHNAGAIGYIGKATPHEGVKVLAVR
jgi:ABC-type phosphate transport system substrate-binding protein